MPSVDIRNLGIVEYTDALELMSTLQQQRINNEIPDTILFLEHPEIVTVGPRARNDGIAPPSDYRSHLSIEEVALPGTDLGNLLFIRLYTGTRTTKNPLQISFQKSNLG